MSGSLLIPARATYLSELKALLVLAWPLVVTNIAQIAIMTTDVAMLGWLGPEALAASSLGANLYFLFFFAGFGFAVASAPLMSAAIGRRDGAVRDVRRTVQQSLRLNALICVPIWIVLWNGEPILIAIGQDPALSAQAAIYLRVMMWGLLPFYGFVVLRNFLAANERPAITMYVTIAAIVLNAASNWLLIFGNLGAPRLEMVGAGLSSVLANLFMFGALAVYVARHRRFRRFRIFKGWRRPDRERFMDLVRLGAPISVAMAFEVSVFNCAAFLAGLIGPDTLAAHAIALQIAAVTFMVPEGIGQAATVRVGHALGRGDHAAIGRAGWTALGCGGAFMVLAAIAFLTVPMHLVLLFLADRSPETMRVAEIAVSLLAIGAIFQIADGAQSIGAGVLRGLQDTRMPMIFAAAGYWGIGFTLAAVLAFPLGFGGVGIWIGLAAGLIVVAIMLVSRFALRERFGLVARAGALWSIQPGLAP